MLPKRNGRPMGNGIGIGRILILRALEDFYLHHNAHGIERCQRSSRICCLTTLSTIGHVALPCSEPLYPGQVTLWRPKRPWYRAACSPAKSAACPYSSSK